ARGVWMAVLTSMLGISSLGCDSPHQLVVATTSAASESSFHYGARITGVLAGQVNGDGTACFWFENGNQREVIVWPHGFTALDNPLRLLNGDDREVVTVGQRITLGGGFSLDEHVSGCDGNYRTWVTSWVVQVFT